MIKPDGRVTRFFRETGMRRKATETQQSATPQDLGQRSKMKESRAQNA